MPYNEPKSLEEQFLASLGSADSIVRAFKKTLIGYLVGTIGSLFMLNQAIPRFGILFAATVFDPLAEWGLSVAVGRSFVFPGTLHLLQRGLGNGVLGLLFFWVASRLP